MGTHSGTHRGGMAADTVRVVMKTKEWTSKSLGWQGLGYKPCACCKQELALDMFTVIPSKNGKICYHSYCHTCKREMHRAYSKKYRQEMSAGLRQARAPQRGVLKQTKERAEYQKAYQKEYRAKNSSTLSTKRVQKYEAQKLAQEKEILSCDYCDICGERGADWWWRRLCDGYYNHVVLHYECREEAIEEGWMHQSARLRRKSLLIEKHKGGK